MSRHLTRAVGPACRVLAVWLGLGVGPALALDCAFTQECLAGETCADTTFEVAVTTNAQTGQAHLETIYGTIIGLYSNTQGALPASVMAFRPETGESYVLSWTEDAAFLTLHLPTDGLAITYLGACQGAG